LASPRTAWTSKPEDGMDGKRFDDLAQTLQARRDRRGVLKHVVQLGAGGALGLAGMAAVAEVTEAKSCQNNKDCPNNKKCKNKKKQNNGKRKGRCK
jgi:hypothetical protein